MRRSCEFTARTTSFFWGFFFGGGGLFVCFVTAVESDFALVVEFDFHRTFQMLYSQRQHSSDVFAPTLPSLFTLVFL